MIRIVSDRLTLKQLTLADVEPLYNSIIASKDELKKWLPWCHDNYQISETSNWVSSQLELWEEGKEFSFAVYKNSPYELIGGVGLNEIHKNYLIGNMGYWIKSSEASKGYATEAALMCAKFGFERIGLKRIEIVTLPENIASKKVAEKLAATYECTARNRLLIRGEPHPACIYSLIPEDLSWCKIELNFNI